VSDQQEVGQKCEGVSRNWGKCGSVVKRSGEECEGVNWKCFKNVRWAEGSCSRGCGVQQEEGKSARVSAGRAAGV